MSSYHSIKAFIKKNIPSKILRKIEYPLRYLFALSQKGHQVECPVCGFKAKAWVVLPDDMLCPKCGSLSRVRRLESLIKPMLKNGISVLDFSPSRSLHRVLKQKKDIQYFSSDLSGDFNADYQFDITNINAPAQSFDLILCYHILEHIDDDAQAMQELYRVLKSTGCIFIQTPFKAGDIYENPSIKSPQDREIHFGQDDHVRIYSVNGLKKRLQNAHFKVEILAFEEAQANKYGFAPKEFVIKCSK